MIVVVSRKVLCQNFFAVIKPPSIHRGTLHSKVSLVVEAGAKASMERCGSNFQFPLLYYQCTCLHFLLSWNNTYTAQSICDQYRFDPPKLFPCQVALGSLEIDWLPLCSEKQDYRKVLPKHSCPEAAESNADPPEQEDSVDPKNCCFVRRHTQD